MMLVDKEKVIEAIEETDWYHINKNGELASGANSTDDIPLYKSDDIYKAIDSVKSVDAQPAVDMLKNESAVNAIPVSFIQERINSLQELAEYEFEANGGYIGKVCFEKDALKNLLEAWEKENANKLL